MPPQRKQTPHRTRRSSTDEQPTPEPIYGQGHPRHQQARSSIPPPSRIVDPSLVVQQDPAPPSLHGDELTLVESKIEVDVDMDLRTDLQRQVHPFDQALFQPLSHNSFMHGPVFCRRRRSTVPELLPISDPPCHTPSRSLFSIMDHHLGGFPGRRSALSFHPTLDPVPETPPVPSPLFPFMDIKKQQQEQQQQADDTMESPPIPPAYNHGLRPLDSYEPAAPIDDIGVPPPYTARAHTPGRFSFFGESLSSESSPPAQIPPPATSASPSSATPAFGYGTKEWDVFFARRGATSSSTSLFGSRPPPPPFAFGGWNPSSAARTGFGSNSARAVVDPLATTSWIPSPLASNGLTQHQRQHQQQQTPQSPLSTLSSGLRHALTDQANNVTNATTRDRPMVTLLATRASMEAHVDRRRRRRRRRQRQRQTISYGPVYRTRHRCADSTTDESAMDTDTTSSSSDEGRCQCVRSSSSLSSGRRSNKHRSVTSHGGYRWSSVDLLGPRRRTYRIRDGHTVERTSRTVRRFLYHPDEDITTVVRRYSSPSPSPSLSPRTRRHSVQLQGRLPSVSTGKVALTFNEYLALVDSLDLTCLEDLQMFLDLQEMAGGLLQERQRHEYASVNRHTTSPSSSSAGAVSQSSSNGTLMDKVLSELLYGPSRNDSADPVPVTEPLAVFMMDYPSSSSGGGGGKDDDDGGKGKKKQADNDTDSLLPYSGDDNSDKDEDDGSTTTTSKKKKTGKDEEKDDADDEGGEVDSSSGADTKQRRAFKRFLRQTPKNVLNGRIVRGRMVYEESDDDDESEEEEEDEVEKNEDEEEEDGGRSTSAFSSSAPSRVVSPAGSSSSTGSGSPSSLQPPPSAPTAGYVITPPAGGSMVVTRPPTSSAAASRSGRGSVGATKRRTGSGSGSGSDMDLGNGSASPPPSSSNNQGTSIQN
ncbi:hypothetical protein BGX23_002399 [Mortierella sp. AD031]|nr:hypothetical protein BGX23_002399 [Mortierella sp. AD031]